MRGNKPSAQYLGQSPRNVCEFLGAAGFCWIWILSFSEIAKPLYETTARSGKDSLEWGPKQEKAFREIKGLLTTAPALELLDVMWDFNLFVHRKITLHLGSSHSWAMAVPGHIPSKQLDPVTTGWPPCLQALATTVVLVREEDKLTLKLKVKVKLCPPLCDPMGCSPPVSSIQGILQPGTQEWVAISFFRGSS